MGEIITRKTLTETGWTSGRIRSAERAGDLVRLRRGVWTASLDPTRTGEHAQRARAALQTAGEGSVVSHLSAAVLWGLPTPERDVGTVWLTRDNDGGGRVREALHLVRSPLDPSEVVELDGVPVTSLPRTANDCARLGGFHYAVMVSDAALRRGCPRDDLVAAARRARRWPGNATARRASLFADARAESPYESRVRAMLWELGLPPAVPQVVVHDAAGRFVARVDLALPAIRLAIEFDGEGKYRDLLDERTSPREAFRAEKVREAALVDAGWYVLRLMKADVHDQARFSRRVRHAVALASRLAGGLAS